MFKLARQAAIAVLAMITMAGTDAFAQNCENVRFGDEAERKPQNVGRDIVGRSLDDIQERGSIKIAVYEDFPPFSYKENGILKGVDIEIGKLIAADLGVEAQFIVTAADENVDGDLRNNVWRGKLIGGQISNVMLHVPYDRELGCRNEMVVLNGQYYNEQLAIAYRKDAYPEDPPVPAYFRFDTVGVENDTLSDFYLTGFARGQLVSNMRRYPSARDAMSALANGEVMAVMAPLSQLEHDLTEGLAVHLPPFPGLAKSSWTLGLAVRHNWRPLSYAVDDAIRYAVEDGRMAKIFEDHGLTYTQPDW
ncbi:cystine transporter subunit [Labrenzia sp. THAF82]|uniref:transporter substrate-binding domain-containing protein n=1 Tax=Labrenzia sp. THAF82 TaxID=2587861 RepID=UPI0012688136|nr:transporter substrate-binding domain-containing protein [Labrenzia sp. THAF82]QFT33026.1 cystine transporter subunit [Labrenzia sp. THAF82]